MEKNKNTSVKISIELWKQFKLYCIKNNITMSKKIEEIIRELVKNGK